MKKSKQMNETWTNWDMRKGSPCFRVLFNLRNQMLMAWPPELLWYTCLVPAAIDVIKGLRSSKVLVLHNLFKGECYDIWRFKTRNVTL